jgi:hypothetical protein
MPCLYVACSKLGGLRGEEHHCGYAPGYRMVRLLHRSHAAVSSLRRVVMLSGIILYSVPDGGGLTA